jgi:alpha-L-rhamnosidase
MGPIVRTLSAGGRDDILWETLQQNDQPSYGYFIASTTENPQGLTTMPERWTREDSKNHMILAQIEEWLHAGIAGIQPGALTTVSKSWGEGLVFQPKLVGDVQWAEGTYQTICGETRSAWNRTTDGAFTLQVTVPANVVAEVRLPAGSTVVEVSQRAASKGVGNNSTVFTVPSGTHTFHSRLEV